MMPYPSLEEEAAMARELLQAPESCLSWEPIPARFSGPWQVDVTHVAEDYGADRQPGENFTIALAAYAEPTDTAPREAAAWRIDFTGCQAYRQRIVGYTGALPLTGDGRPVAFWEITGSHYLVESGVWAGTGLLRSTTIHHFVIVSEIHTVHEVLALGWRCTPLPQEWAKTFNGPMPKWPPVEV